MKFGIIVDSGCDLRMIEDSEKSDIYYQRVALTLRVGEVEYVDDDKLNISEFMSDMKSYTGTTSSAAPAPMEWYDAFMAADEIFAITLTSQLSGSYNSAMTAKKMILEEHPDKKIYVIDSKAAGSGLTILVYKLKELILKGLSFEEIKEEIEDYQKRTNLFFILESFDNLIKNGRVSKFQASMAGILGIKLLCGASEQGTIEVLKKYRGKLTVYEKMLQEMAARGFRGGKVVISHCFNPEKVQYIEKIIREKFPKTPIDVMPTGGLCSYYAERGGIILTFEC